jgi:protein-tyrosine-phosphatase
MDTIPTVVFVCAHGAAKSVLAAADFERLARARGRPLRAIARGIDPDPEVAPRVAATLLQEGTDLRNHPPQRVMPDELASAWKVVSFGEELGDLAPGGRPIIRWDDIPAVSDDLPRARRAIAARLPDLLES